MGANRRNMVNLSFARFRGHRNLGLTYTEEEMSGGGTPYPEEFRQKIVELHETGRSIAELADEW